MTALFLFLPPGSEIVSCPTFTPVLPLTISLSRACKDPSLSFKSTLFHFLEVKCILMVFLICFLTFFLSYWNLFCLVDLALFDHVESDVIIFISVLVLQQPFTGKHFGSTPVVFNRAIQIKVVQINSLFIYLCIFSFLIYTKTGNGSFQKIVLQNKILFLISSYLFYLEISLKIEIVWGGGGGDKCSTFEHGESAVSTLV